MYTLHKCILQVFNVSVIKKKVRYNVQHDECSSTVIGCAYNKEHIVAKNVLITKKKHILY